MRPRPRRARRSDERGIFRSSSRVPYYTNPRSRKAVGGFRPSQTIDVAPIDITVVSSANELNGFKAALANRNASPVDIFVVGDSITEGTSSTDINLRWVSRMRDELRTWYPTANVAGGEGFITGQYIATSFANGWDYQGAIAGDGTLGMGHKCAVIGSPNGYLQRYFTGTSVDIAYITHSSLGSFQVFVDGVLAATQSSAGDGTVRGGNRLRVTFGTRGTHLVKIAWVAGGNNGTSYINGVFGYDQDELAGVRVIESAQHGSNSANWSTTTNGNQYIVVRDVEVIQPKLIIIELGENDRIGGVAPATFKTNILQQIADYRAVTVVDPDFVLIIAYELVPTYAYAWSLYVKAMREIADADAQVSIVDLSTMSAAEARIYYGLDTTDEVHPNNVGQGRIWDAVRSEITNCVQIDRLLDADPIDVTAQPTVIDMANLVDADAIDITVQPATLAALRAQVLRPSPIDITVQPATPNAFKAQVLRPSPVDTTVEIPVVTYGRGVHPNPVDVTVQPATITWPRIVDIDPVDVTVERPAVGVRLTNNVRPTPVDITVETPTVTADVIQEIELFLSPIDITVTALGLSASTVKLVTPIDVAVQIPAVDPAWITDVNNPVDVTVESPSVTTRVTKNIGYVDVTVQPTPTYISKVKPLTAIDTTVETPAVETDHIIRLSPIDITVELPLVKIIRTSYGIGAINTTVDVAGTPVDVANIVDVAPIDITVQPATLGYYRTVTLQPVNIDAGPLDVSLIQSSYSIDYIDITVEPVRPHIVREYFVSPVDITVELLNVVTGAVKPVAYVDITVQPAVANAVVTSNVRDVIPVTVQPATPLELDYVIKLQPIDIVVTPSDLDLAYSRPVGAIDITVEPAPAAGFSKHLIGIIDVTVDASGFTQALHQFRPNPVNVTVEAIDVDVANIVDVDSIDIVAAPRPVITIITKRVAAIDITASPATPMPKLQRILKLPAFDITTQPAALPKLQKVYKLQPINLNVFLAPASASSFDDTPIDINVELPPVTIGFGVEDFSRIKDLPTPAYVQPTRVIAQDILTKRFLHWELPVSNLTVQYTLSGPQVISGEFSNEILDFRDLGLEPWGTWIHIEENGVIRASGILQPNSLDDAEKLTLEAVGVSAYPAGQPFDSIYEGIALDPANIVRAIWAHLQTFPDAKFGVQVTGNTTVKLGKPFPPAPPNPLPENYVEPENKDDKPYSLVWYEAPDCGSEIASLAQETPFDFVERNVWNADKTDVLHYIDIGFPRIGTRRSDLRFAQEENLVKAVGPEETEDFYASAVIVMGKGEGTALVRGYAGRPYKNRVRRVVILDDATIDNVARANSLAQKELDRRQALLDIKEIEIDARHPNARLGEFGVGDDIPLIATVPWQGDINQWERVLSYTYYPDNETIRVQLQRSESFVYGTGSTV